MSMSVGVLNRKAKPKAVRINPPKPAANGLGTDFVSRMWTLIEDAIKQIFNKNSSKLSYEELYRNTYNMVLHRQGDLLYNNVEDVVSDRLHVLAAEISQQRDESFLKFTTQVWEDYSVATRMIKDILMYMDRNYVAEHNKRPIYENGVYMFKTVVIEQSGAGKRIKTQMLNMIRDERLGNNVNRMLMREVSNMLLELGMSCYQEVLERDLLDMTAKYYRDLSREMINSLSVSDYLRMAEEKMRAEGQRVEYYLVETTRPPLEEILRRELITNHMSVLLESESGFLSMLRDEKKEDLARMFMLFSFSDKALATMKARMRQFIVEQGKAYVADKEKHINPVSYIQGLVDMNVKFGTIVACSFQGSREFVLALHSAFEEFVNSTESHLRTAEYLSLYVDDKLKKGIKAVSEDEVEITLDMAMVLFRFLQDKDIFEKYYKSHLARRLLSGRSASEDTEKSFISKLKAECGFQFTAKLEGMFKDMKLSSEILKNFKKDLAKRNKTLDGTDFSVCVLTTGSWPAYKPVDCVLPDELQLCCTEFKQYYTRVHSGRILTWHHNMGDGMLLANYRTRQHELNVATYQMIILLLFNKMDTLTLQQLLEMTKIPRKDLIKSLLPLCAPKAKILCKEPKELKTVNDTDTFTYNPDFKSNNVRIKIGMAVVKETEEENAATKEKIEQDRKPQLEAAIVRIMKSRKQLHHNQLVDEVVRQCQARFKPTPAAIKSRIESLIEREFLERSETDRKLYKYMA